MHLQVTTGEEMTVAVDMIAGDTLTIDTRQGSKSVKLTRSGTVTNVLNDFDGDWVSIDTGANTISFDAASGAANLTASVTLYPLYEGV